MKMENNQQEKSKIRSELQKRLLEMTDKQRSEKSRRACRNLISTPQFQQASTIMMYLSLPHEVDTSEAILHAWQLGKVVGVPKISWQQRHMIAVRINSLETGFSTSASGPLKWRDNGADGGGRTHTPLRVPDFESSASANSATSALVPSNIRRQPAK